MTDVSCWLPIIALKALAFLSYEISADVYAWIVVFILPLNSAVNPLLYTFTTRKYRDKLFARKMSRGSDKSTRNNKTKENSNPDESQPKIAYPILVSLSSPFDFKYKE